MTEARADARTALENFAALSRSYEDALQAADTLKQARDQALLDAQRSCGASVRELAARTGLSAPRVGQILKRARNAEQH